MQKVSRRGFAKRAAVGLAAAPLAAKWAGAWDVHDGANAQLERVQESRADELKKKAEAQREQLVGRLRAKPLAYDLEPAFVFAARPKPRPRKKN